MIRNTLHKMSNGNVKLGWIIFDHFNGDQTVDNRREINKPNGNRKDILRNDDN